jgi:hypothetical protein
MSSDLVHADPNDVKKLAKALQQWEQRITDASKQAESAINSANWHDRQKDQFTAHFKDFQKRTRGFVGGEVKQMVGSLNKLASDLERAKNNRM